MFNSSGNGYNGTIQNSTYTDGTTGKINNGLEFNGTPTAMINTTDYTIADWSSTDAFSFELWFKYNSKGDSFQFINKAEDDEDDGYLFHWDWITKRITFFMFNNFPTNVLWVQALGTNPVLGTWYHYVITKTASASASGVRIYQNGINMTLSVQMDTLAGDTTTDTCLLVAGHHQGTPFPLDGILDEFVAYNYTLNTTEIAYRYNLGSGRQDTGNNAQLDYEVASLGLPYDSLEEISIYTGTITDYEPLGVYGCNGTVPPEEWVFLGNLTGASSWANFSTVGLADNIFSSYAIRFLTYEDPTITDTVVSSWQIDHILLKTQNETYRLDLEIGWLSLDYTEADNYLCIYPVTGDGWPDEDILVNIWNGSWAVLFTDLVPDQWNNISIDPYLTDGSIEVQFLGGSEVSDLIQDAWSIDAVLITTFPYTFFYDLFLSPQMWGYLGPIGIVVIGYLLCKKDKSLGVLWFVIECLFMSQYFLLVAATPAYWWHIVILLFGGLLTCVYPLWDR